MFGKRSTASSAATPSPVLAERLKAVTRRQDSPFVATAKPTSYDDVQRRRRCEPRERTFKTGAISLPCGERMQVVIKDISKRGCRVEFFRHVPLPALMVISEATLKLKRRARLAWSDEGVAGLEFVD